MARCGQLWRLWARIAAELLIAQELPIGELGLRNEDAVTTTAVEAAKLAFMDLIAPKSGVGEQWVMCYFEILLSF